MLDIKLIRERPDLVRADLKKRGSAEKGKLLDHLIADDQDYRQLLQELETLRHQKNLRVEEMGKRIREGEKPDRYRKDLKALGERIAAAEAAVEEKKAAIDAALMRLPNLLHDSVPIGRDDSQNVEVRSWGKKPSFAFTPKGHEELGVSLGILDIERAAKIAGARFSFLKNEGVLLAHALERLALDRLREKGFSPVLPPFFMRRQPYEGVVDLGDFQEMMYKIDDEDLYLIATSEHPLVAQYQGETLNEADLPVRLAGISSCFRKEAGSHGKDTKGIFRVHQFTKVEQIVLSRPEDSWTLHEELIKNAEDLFRALELPYRVVNVCTGDIGSIAAKKYDLEAWLPVQGRYREMVSCSNATDYQARRLRIKYGKRDSPPAGLVHILNSTALVPQRVIVALLETYQQRDGSVVIPKALVPYTGFKKIEPQ
ncbi:MAG: serine--tRNA ligase [Candidatus Aenigmarchaeota archaeon]|nr:serine--tRNA ligase [Candidatus Aenigmarchaeota archaeon]